MSILGIVRRLWRSIGTSARIDQSPGSLSLMATIRQERARIDRCGGEFSLVTFAENPSSKNRRALRQVANHLASRMRIIDKYSWTSDNRLWLLLPECPTDAAASLAREVCRNFSQQQQQVVYDLYHYAAGDDGDRHGCCQREPQPDYPDFKEANNFLVDVGSMDSAAHRAVETLVVRATPLWKRAVDVAVATIAILILSPVMLVISGLIKLTSPGPIFFVQMRAGKSGKPFLMYKFRTMVADAEQRKANLLCENEQDGPAFKMEKDPRITAIGRLLRATSIDELPQLWNVLRGDMSLVGPRPLPLDEAGDCLGWHQERLDVTPGLTCLWQVCDRRTKIPFTDWMRMDIRYARRRTLGLDMRLILRTIAFVVRRKGF